MKDTIQRVVAILLVVGISLFAVGSALGETEMGPFPSPAIELTAPPITKEYNTSLDLNDTKVIVVLTSTSQIGSYLDVGIRFGYNNPKDPLESVCFSDKLSLAVFQNDIACRQIYVEGAYSKNNASTAVRNNASVEFSMRFALNDEKALYELVFMPRDARGASEYVRIHSPW